MANHPRPPSLFSARAAILTILLIGASAAIWGFYDARGRNRQHAEEEFYRRTAILHSLTREIISSYESALFGLQLAFTLDGGITRDEFAGITRTLARRYPGVTAFEWVPAVSAAQRPALEATLPRGPGGEPRTFTERDAAGQLVRVGDRPEYYPVLYTEPFKGNERALGYDVNTGPRHAILEQARQTRAMALSEQIRLISEYRDREQWGVVMIWPVYRATGAAGGPGAFLGFVQAVFRIRDMLEATRNRTWNAESILDMMFVDESEPVPARHLLYYRPSDPQAAGQPAPTEQEFRQGLCDVRQLTIGGRNWKILYRPRAGWLAHQITPLPWVRTAGIMSITFLLAGLVHIQGRRSAIIAREVTERTAELNESRRLLDSLLHALPGMAYRCLYDRQLKVLYVSEGALALTGYSPDDFVWGKVHFRQLIHPDDVERVRAATLAGLEQHRDIEVEYRLLTQARTEKWILSRARGVYGDDGQLLFLEGLAIDITANKQAETDKLAFERKLLEGQKLESLGLLAGGIAHDFNNILTGILGNANLARFKLGHDSAATAFLHKIELGTARAAELCQQMLAYSGKGSFLIEPVDLSQLVQDTLPLLHTSVASRARLLLNLSPRPVVVLADATQLRQIVMNLVLNAADAVDERSGEIVITTGLRPCDREFLSATRDGDALPPGDYASVEVRDNGCGMSPETVARIFDPFFTTKFAGRGLGLAAVRGIVRGHHGALHVTSTPGQGSTFTLLLPPSREDVAEPVPEATVPRHFTGKALVVDDEAPIRETTAALLATCGFTVETAENGSQGITKFCASPDDFRVVLLDLTMPGLSGDDTLAALRAVAPQVRVLLISGYSENARTAGLANAGPVAFLQKPFTRGRLEAKLGELLG